MNKVIFCGNLTRDFEYRVNSNVAVARGSMALNRGKDKDGKDKGADFVNLVAFNKTAELMDKYGRKGRKFLFICHVNTGSYEKDGHKVYTTDFVIDNVEFIDSRPENNTQEATTEEASGFMPMPADISDEELPFA